jgi:glycosyltransferase involved in cell wall biosynthesis
MQKKILYWSPCLNKVGTVKSTINSAIALKKYSNSNFEPIIINACGEWDEYLEIFKSNQIEVIDLSKKKYFKYLPKEGFLFSRFSYILIFVFSFFPLLKVLKKIKNAYLVAHLITSLPIFLFNVFNINNKLVLRISGLPKLNYLRKNFWKMASIKIDVITCPSLELIKKLVEDGIFHKQKVFFLPDAIYQVKDFINKKKHPLESSILGKKRIILGIGRLTRQKNFSFLINEFSIFFKKNKDFRLLILGDGEEKSKLQNIIKAEKLENDVFLVGRVDNIFNYLKSSEIFIMSSLWEDPGFVLVEAGLGNSFVISSDCPNGPKEILDYGKNGLLYKSNLKYEIANTLNDYLLLNNKRRLVMKKNLKKYISKYSIFRHYLSFEKIFK